MAIKPLKITLTDVFLLFQLHCMYELELQGDYGELMTEHLNEFIQMFGEMAKKEKPAYNLKFTSLQACAFTKLWLVLPYPDAIHLYS